MWKSRAYILLSTLAILVDPLVAETSVFNVVKLGAKPNGKAYSTKSFMKAWAGACDSANHAVIIVPAGKFLMKNVVFNGPCKNTYITFCINGTLVAPSDYNALGKSENWISFQRVTGVSIYGGTLDGRGAPLWACKLAKKKCPEGATTLSVTFSKDIIIQGLKSLNSQMFHIVINRCENVYMSGIMITASGNSPNTDGIHVQMSTGVTIMSSGIKTGDDCISIGPGTVGSGGLLGVDEDLGTRNLWIEHIACGPGHGISIGSLAKDLDEDGVQNVTVKTVVFTGTDNGIRIKSWGRPSNGFVKEVLFQQLYMKNVRFPIVIDQNYCPRNENCPGKVSGVKISKITYQDIQGTSATKIAVKFDCSAKRPCSDIALKNVKHTYKNRPAIPSCNNADGSAHGVVKPEGCL